MKTVIVGGAGFVGKNLIKELSKLDMDIVSIDIFDTEYKNKKVKSIKADTTKKGEWQAFIKESDIVVNLAGATIFNLWSEKYKKLIYDSRILTTRNIVDAMESKRPQTLISTSAAGYYGDRKNDELKEDEPNGAGFLAKVCLDWENEALRAREKNTRVVLPRFGVVIGKGGAMNKILPLSKLMMNPVLGKGDNFFPWIHIEDLCKAILFIMDKKNLDGAINFTSNSPTTQKAFTHAVYKVVGRPPLIFHIPGFLVRTVMGELGKNFMFSQKIIPFRLMENGFKFSFNDISKAIRSIYQL